MYIRYISVTKLILSSLNDNANAPRGARQPRPSSDSIRFRFSQGELHMACPGGRRGARAETPPRPHPRKRPAPCVVETSLSPFEAAQELIRIPVLQDEQREVLPQHRGTRPRRSDGEWGRQLGKAEASAATNPPRSGGLGAAVALERRDGARGSPFRARPASRTSCC